MQSQKSQEQQSDLLFKIAGEVESLTKVAARKEAENLAKNIEENYFRLGGILKVIHENAWYDGFESFESFVMENYGFKERKARYLMDIYTNLVSNSIPWEKVKVLGWTKLKDLSHLLTIENVDSWVEKASAMTVSELKAMLSGSNAESSQESGKTSSDTTNLTFKLKIDQYETITSALAKAKAEVETEYDNVALEMICAGYLGGTIQADTSDLSFKDMMKGLGWEKTLHVFSELFPDIDLEVALPEDL